jgi:hypothetical protein
VESLTSTRPGGDAHKSLGVESLYINEARRDIICVMPYDFGQPPDMPVEAVDQVDTPQLTYGVGAIDAETCDYG